jgi:hypothetical protein
MHMTLTQARRVHSYTSSIRDKDEHRYAIAYLRHLKHAGSATPDPTEYSIPKLSAEYVASEIRKRLRDPP